MPITVRSPYSGHPVKVRDQDINRAVRDEEGRIFYVVERSDGKGYYSSPTRQGSAKDEQRYEQMEAKGAALDAARRPEPAGEPVYDATGPGRRGGTLRRWAFLIFILLVLALGVWAAFNYELFTGPTTTPIPPSPPGVPGETETEPESDIIMEEDPPGPAEHGPIELVPEPHELTEPDQPDNPTQSGTRGPEPAQPEVVRTASGASYRVDAVGEGAAATAGKYVLVRCRRVGADANADAEPVGFVLWSGQVARGWDEALAGMRVGGRRTVTGLGMPKGEAEAVAVASAAQAVAVELLDVRDGVAWTDAVVGEGVVARPGDVVTVHYRGFVEGQDEPFDATDGREPLRFRIGAGEVIAGWELGVTGMHAGGQRTLVIPPWLGYGSRGAGGVVPPGATLRFEVELIEVEPAGATTRRRTARADAAAL